MGHKESKPWSFGLLGGKKGTKSVIALVVIVIISILTHIVGAVSNEIKDQRERPSLALKSLLRDVRGFIKTEKKVPANFRELEVKVWNKDNPTAPTKLLGNNICVFENYEYIYFSGNVQGINLVNVWAIPQGKYRDEFDTVLMIIAPEGEIIWRGPALNDEQRQFVLAKGFNPTFPQMAQLNMKKDPEPSQAPPKKGLFK